MLEVVGRPMSIKVQIPIAELKRHSDVEFVTPHAQKDVVNVAVSRRSTKRTHINLWSIHPYPMFPSLFVSAYMSIHVHIHACSFYPDCVLLGLGHVSLKKCKAQVTRM